VESIATIHSTAVTVPVKREERVMDIRLRTGAKPDKDVAMLLSQLSLQLPNSSKRLQNVVEKKAWIFPQTVDYKRKVPNN
jgi:hypothetical protein